MCQDNRLGTFGPMPQAGICRAFGPEEKPQKTWNFVGDLLVAMPLGVSPTMKKASSAAETIMAFLRLSRAAQLRKFYAFFNASATFFVNVAFSKGFWRKSRTPASRMLWASLLTL